MNKNKTSFSLLCFAMLSTSAVNSETSFSIQPLLHRFDYTEFGTTGQQLDRETGWIPGIKFQINTKLGNTLKATFESSIIGGTVDYNGQTQSGIPVITITDTKITSHGVRLAVPFSTGLELFGSSRYTQWERDIKDNISVSGFFEEYTWWELSVGLKSEIWRKNNQRLHLEFGLLRIKQPEIFVDLTKFNWGSTTLQIGEEYGGRFQLEWSRPNGNAWSLGVNAYLEFWDFGRSNTKNTTGGFPNVGVTEPRSETRNVGLQLSLKHLFK